MKYEVINGLQTKDKYFAEGEIIDKSDIPQKSIKWFDRDWETFYT